MGASRTVAGSLLLLLALSATARGQQVGSDEQQPHRALAVSREYVERDIEVAQALRPLKEAHNLIFWRLQKVGSSTLLSLLLSYAYRFHFMPRRKASANAFCRAIAGAALASHLAVRDPNSSAADWERNASISALLPPSSRESALLLEHWRGRESEALLSDALHDRLTVYVRSNGRKRTEDHISARIPFRMVLSHEICNADAETLRRALPLAFPAHEHSDSLSHSLSPEQALEVASVDEVFMLRDPLARAVSVYYFWGELFKLAKHMKRPEETRTEQHPETPRKRKKKPSSSSHRSRRLLERERSKRSGDTREDMIDTHTETETETGTDSELRRALAMLGAVRDGKEARGFFRYHGNESSAPPLDVALAFAQSFPYRAGMPGPSFSWSAFADNANDTLRRVQETDEVDSRLFTVVLERLDESLVALRYFLNWSLADLVMVKQRKALSSHPKSHEWPQEAVVLLQEQLREHREYEIYDAAVSRLDERLRDLSAAGVDVQQEVLLLQSLRKKVTSVCLDQEHYLDHYRKMIASHGLQLHHSNNKLRDVEQKYFDGGHVFSLNMEILGSFDVCGACEAHALLKGIELGLSSTVENSTTLFDLDFEKYRKDDVNFRNCPRTPSHDEQSDNNTIR